MFDKKKKPTGYGVPIKYDHFNSKITSVSISSNNVVFFIASHKLYKVDSLSPGKPIRIGDYDKVTQVLSFDVIYMFINNKQLYISVVSLYTEVPKRISGYDKVTHFSFSYSYCMFVSDGNVYQFGDLYHSYPFFTHDHHVLLDNSDNITQIKTLEKVSYVSVGRSSAVFISNGMLYGIGDNKRNHLGYHEYYISHVIKEFTHVAKNIITLHVCFVGMNICYLYITVHYIVLVVANTGFLVVILLAFLKK